jgi:hypothetical protein
MRFNFFRRFRILPGLWLNVSKRSVSTTVGVRGLKATFGKRGRTTTVGLPGTGMSVSHTVGHRRKADVAPDLALLDKALGRKRRPRD